MSKRATYTSYALTDDLLGNYLVIIHFPPSPSLKSKLIFKIKKFACLKRYSVYSLVSTEVLTQQKVGFQETAFPKDR